MPMKRRDFIKEATIGSLLLHFKTSLFAQEKIYPDLALIQGDSPALITKEAISFLGGIKRFISR